MTNTFLAYLGAILIVSHRMNNNNNNITNERQEVGTSNPHSVAMVTPLSSMVKNPLLISRVTYPSLYGRVM